MLSSVPLVRIRSTSPRRFCGLSLHYPALQSVLMCHLQVSKFTFYCELFKFNFVLSLLVLHFVKSLVNTHWFSLNLEVA